MNKKKQNLLRDDIEYSVHCEENGKVIGPISKLHAHQNGARGAICHYSTWSMVFCCGRISPRGFCRFYPITRLVRQTMLITLTGIIP